MSRNLMRTPGGPTPSAAEKGTNIQVVVRCRGRNEQERRENSPLVVEVPPVKGREVSIKGPAQQRYHFDRVFGPQADQELVYRDIVTPILDEVMQGYNCTIFAYGQTGTGKTYTMEGDLGIGPPHAGGRMDFGADAGIIPRTLQHLFYTLDKQASEYYMRVSFLELYNEELRDLLAGGDMGVDSGSGLKVYDSGTDKGVVVQGLEEKPVTSARDAISLLQAGSARRRVAATQCNDASSRSHALFTVTMYIRERAVTAAGEDVVKLGKLNLVDLAGSENIGRSGAENQRAREAGSINKSLLVLGRVINALVEKHSHVPYRDSKLTRILQDSLGGRTRTCLVATISPARSNIEETLKTLKYAHQAKSIRNKPEANRKVAKADIVNELHVQIERLMSDLDAARDGSGFYVTRETYDQLTGDARSAKELADEWRRRVDVWEAEAERVTSELARVTGSYNEAARRLEETEAELRTTSRALDTERVVARARAEHEAGLHTTASTLRATAGAMGGEIRALHEGVARISDRERRNLRAVAEVGEVVARETQRALAAMAENRTRARTDSQRILETLRTRLGDGFSRSLANRADACRESVSAHVDAVRARTDSASSGVRDDVARALDAIAAEVGGLSADVAEFARQSMDACRESADEIEEWVGAQARAVEAAAADVSGAVADGAAQASSVLEQAQGDTAQAVRDLVALIESHQAASSERLRQAEAVAAASNEAAAEADARIVDQIKAMIEQRRQQSANALGELVGCVRGADQETGRVAGEALAAVKGIDSRVADGVAGAVQSLGVARNAVGTRISEHVKDLGVRTAEVARAVRVRADASKTHAEKATERAATCAKSVLETGGNMQKSAADSLEALAAFAETSASEVRSDVAGMQSEVSASAGTVDAVRDEVTASVESQAAGTEAFLENVDGIVQTLADRTTSEIRENVAPSSAADLAPKKRHYETADSWRRTRPRSEIVATLDAAERGESERSVNELTEDLGWTGIEVAADSGFEKTNGEDTDAMDLSDEHEDGATVVTEDGATVVAEDGGDAATSGSQTQHGSDELSSPEGSSDARVLRKRTSDIAISPTLEDEFIRPTQRPRTRLTRVSSVESSRGPSPSAIPVPASNAGSKLPIPQRNRRAQSNA